MTITKNRPRLVAVTVIDKDKWNNYVLIFSTQKPPLQSLNQPDFIFKLYSGKKNKHCFVFSVLSIGRSRLQVIYNEISADFIFGSSGLTFGL